MQRQLKSPKKPSQRAWVTRLNVRTAKEYGLTAAEFDRARKDYEGLTQKELLKKALPPGLAELVGPNGELAYVRNDSNPWEHNKHTLVLEVPLSLTATQKREAIRQATNFFERLYIADQEAVPKGGQFARITRKPYSEMSMREGDPAKQPMPEYDVRTVWHHKRKEPYGSRTSQASVLNKRNGWIRKRYKELRAQHGHKYMAFRLCEMIQDELAKLPSDAFGSWVSKRRNPLLLSIDAIQRIATSSK